MTTHSNTRSSSALALWLAAAVLTLNGVAPSHAQQPAENARTFISINGGLQALTGSFSESVDFPESGGVYGEVLSAAAAQEQARFESDYRYRSGPLFDVSGGVRIAPYFALGAGISWFNSEETASVSAQLPHPLFFNRHRAISGVSSPLTRSEMAVHLQAHVVLPVTNSLTVMGFCRTHVLQRGAANCHRPEFHPRIPLRHGYVLQCGRRPEIRLDYRIQRGSRRHLVFH